MGKTNLITEMSKYRYLPHRRDRINDHAADAMRYFFISNPPVMKKRPSPLPYIVAGIILGAVLAIVAVYLLFYF